MLALAATSQRQKKEMSCVRLSISKAWLGSGQSHAKDVRFARDNLYSKTRLTRTWHARFSIISLCRTSFDFSSHASHTRLAFSSRVSCQKLLTKPRVCVMIFPASERDLLCSNWILRGIAQLVEQRSPNVNRDLIPRMISGFLRLETSVSSLFSCFQFCKSLKWFMQNRDQNRQKSAEQHQKTSNSSLVDERLFSDVWKRLTDTF